MILDQATQTNLELIRNVHDGSRKHTLFEVLDGAITPMGSRMIKKWIMRPLVKQQPIMQRHDVLEQFLTNVVAMQTIGASTCELGDFERVLGRIALRRGTVHDYGHLKRVLGMVPTINHILSSMQPVSLLRAIMSNCSDFNALHQLLCAALNDDASKEWIIKPGFDQDLDYMRDLASNATQKIMDLEAHEQKLTGIGSLKIRYNQVYGYYIEVTKTHADSIPDRYIRQQTLVGRERYVTAELQQMQHEILRAQAEMANLEKTIFERVKNEVSTQITALRKLSHALANLDALLGLARISYQNSYIRPQFNTDRQIHIMEGRHPVVERVIGHGFIPNNTQLTDDAIHMDHYRAQYGGKIDLFTPSGPFGHNGPNWNLCAR